MFLTPYVMCLWLMSLLKPLSLFYNCLRPDGHQITQAMLGYGAFRGDVRFVLFDLLEWDCQWSIKIRLCNFRCVIDGIADIAAKVRDHCRLFVVSNISHFGKWLFRMVSYYTLCCANRLHFRYHKCEICSPIWISVFVVENKCISYNVFLIVYAVCSVFSHMLYGLLIQIIKGHLTMMQLIELYRRRR